ARRVITERLLDRADRASADFLEALAVGDASRRRLGDEPLVIRRRGDIVVGHAGPFPELEICQARIASDLDLTAARDDLGGLDRALQRARDDLGDLQS